MGHEGPAGRIVHVAGAHHEATRAPPEILLAVAVEIQPRDPAGRDGLAVDEVPGLVIRNVLETATAVATIVPEARSRTKIAMRQDECILATVAVEVDEYRVEAIGRVVQRVDPLRCLVDERQWPRRPRVQARTGGGERSEEHTSELQSLMRISYAVL